LPSHRDLFLSAVSEARRADWLAIADLEKRLARLLAEAQAAWPAVSLDEKRFWTHVAERTESVEQLERIRAADLYLACACAEGVKEGLLGVERHYLQELDGPLHRAGANAEQIAEVRQTLRSQLFAGDRPGINNYRGDGDLRSWLRVIATRETVHMRRRGQRHVPLGDALSDAADRDPELRYLQRMYEDEFKRALKDTVDELTARQRNLLKLQFIDALTLDQIAVFYRVHRATVARWLAEAKSSLLLGTKERLRQRLNLPEGEVESLVRLLAPDLEITIRGLLNVP
jgi:RNA polymerase sigma-70 factor (ECF subfamily)